VSPVSRLSEGTNVISARLLDALPRPPELAFRAPGRANLIGEHTDYNDGFVLPVALEPATVVAGRRRNREVVVRSLDEDGEVRVDLRTGVGPTGGWGRYVSAVVRALRDADVQLEGFEGVLSSTVPQGAGLASSAALEVAIAIALAAEPLDPVALAEVCRRAENDYVGVRSGIMDQLISAAGRAGHALLIDCRANTLEAVPLPDEVTVLLIDSGIRRDLAHSAYNERRSECEEAASALGVATLRDASLEALDDIANPLDVTVYRRAHHVITENERVIAVAAALRGEEVSSLAPLFASSHESLARDYQVSIPELDRLVALAVATDGVVGARLTGAGFGGCTVNLVTTDAAEGAAEEIVARYREATGRDGRSWISRPAAGAGRVAL
jgi:galactokinase